MLKIHQLLQIHSKSIRFRGKYTKMRYSSLEFDLSAVREPFHCEYYRKPENQTLCGHDESSMQDENKCGLCGVNYDDSFD